MIDPNLFQLMAEQVKDYAVFLLDVEGRILSWNLGAQKIKGYRPEEIIGKHFSIFYPADAIKRDWPAHELHRAMIEGRFEDEGIRVRKDGTRFWANVVITALRDPSGKLLAFSKITRDLTERRAQEEALRQSEERLRLLVERVLDYAIYMLDPEGLVSSWNMGAERITGYTKPEILGRHFSNFYPGQDVVAGKPWQELLQAHHNGRAEHEGWRLRKDGKQYWGRDVVTPLYDVAGHLHGYAIVTQDMSQQRHLLELQSTMQKLSDFIALLAHEIRNPLAPIAMALRLMDSAAPDDPVHKKMRQLIERQTTRLSHIAEDMIDINRITRGELAIRGDYVDVKELLERSVEVSAPWLQAREHRLRVELPPEELGVTGDLQRLIQVLTNLMNNAARYTPAAGEILLRAWRTDGHAVISVKDNGRGIRAEFLQSIFKMFVQGRAPLERIGEGLGVGLALARNIVELHGGTIEAVSEGEGKGSEFLVRLPLAAQLPVAAATPQADKEPAATPRSRRVLIVDDNADAAATLELLIQLLGHQTRVAHEGSAALNAFDEFAPDIVLLDIGLPGISGYEVARRLRSRRADGFRIIAITGWGQAEDCQRSADAGFDVHLVKPVDEQQLRDVLNANGSTGIVH